MQTQGRKVVRQGKYTFNSTLFFSMKHIFQAKIIIVKINVIIQASLDCGINCEFLSTGGSECLERFLGRT